MLCFVLQRTPTNENNGGTEWQGIQQLLLLTSAILDILLWTLCKAHVTYPSKKKGRDTAREAEALLSNPKYPFPSLLCRDFPLLCKMVGAQKQNGRLMMIGSKKFYSRNFLNSIFGPQSSST